MSIQNNHVHHNGIIEESGQRIGNGIMLHRSSDKGIVRNNTVHDNMDSGVALFESFECTVSENKIYSNMSESCGKIFLWLVRQGREDVLRFEAATMSTWRVLFKDVFRRSFLFDPYVPTTADESALCSLLFPCSAYLLLSLLSLLYGRRNPAVPRLRRQPDPRQRDHDPRPRLEVRHLLLPGQRHPHGRVRWEAEGKPILRQQHHQ